MLNRNTFQSNLTTLKDILRSKEKAISNTPIVAISATATLKERKSSVFEHLKLGQNGTPAYCVDSYRRRDELALVS